MKAKQVGVFEAKSQLSKLIDEVLQTGSPILLTKHGKPVVQLAPLPSQALPRVRGCAASPGFYMAEDFDAPLEDFAEYQLLEIEAERAAETPPGA
jgi:prevent-host-death family protein